MPVSNDERSKDVRDLQFMNISRMVVTLPVLNDERSKDVSAVQP